MKPFILNCRIIVFLIPLLAPPLKGAMVLHMLDVGYGSAVHMEEEGINYLFDVGPEASAQKVLDHLSSHMVTRLNGIFITHAHPDHMGALLKIMDQIGVERVYWNDMLPPDEENMLFINDAEKYAPFVTLKPGAKMRISRHVELQVLRSTITSNNLNENSLVYLLQQNQIKILLTGDIGKLRQKNLAELEHLTLEKVTWVMWPHHGDALDPTFRDSFKRHPFCAVSVGENKFGLPIANLKSEAEKFCSMLSRTDVNGSVSFAVDKKIHIFKEPPSDDW